MKKTLKEMQSIARDFEIFIKGRSFGFSENLSSFDNNIVRYNEGLEKISNLTGVSLYDLEKNKEKNQDDGLVDVRFLFNNVVFEYSFVYEKDKEDDIDINNGWWRIFYVTEDGAFDDIDLLYEEDEEDED